MSLYNPHSPPSYHDPTNKVETTIKCNENHKICMFEKILSIYEEKQLVDVTLIAEMDGFKIQAHRVVLSASSDYFRAMFSSSLKKANLCIASDGIILKDIDGPTLKTIVNFIYSASIELAEENIENLIKAADFFQMQTLKDICCDFMKEQLEPGNCLGIASFAEQYNQTDLYKASTTFIQRNFNEVSKEEEFLQLDAKQLAKLLSNDNISVKSEEDIFRSLMAWVQYDEIIRYDITESLLPVVRFSLLSPAFIIENAKLLRQRLECDEIISSWLEWHDSNQKDYHHKPRSAYTKIAALIPSNGHFKLYMYDINHKTWSSEELPPAPKMVDLFTPIVIGHKLIIVGGTRFDAGGIGDVGTNRVQCFDLITRKWSDMPAMLEARCEAAVIELDEEMFVIGGFSKSKGLLSTVKYNFKTGKWYNCAPHNVESEHKIKIEKLDGKLYINNGYYSNIYCYDPALNKWSKIYCPYEEYYFPNIVAAGEFLYLVGGMVDRVVYSAVVYRYHPRTNNWSTVASLSSPRMDVICFGFHDRIISCLGYSEDTHHFFIEEYNPVKDEWTICSSFTTPDYDEFESAVYFLM